ncbi:MAG: RhuM family protein [Enterocloster sp.]
MYSDKKRLENGQIFDEEYFEHLLDEIRGIRASERKFYQKITDIYATAVDYSKRCSNKQREFFKTVQNKLRELCDSWLRILRKNAEVMVERADHKKEHMGLTTWKNAPGGKIVKADVSRAEELFISE